MKKDYRRSYERQQIHHDSSAYVYLVRNPATNELAVFAWDSVLYPGTSVIIPTRYGLDLGTVVSDASGLGRPYTPGSAEIRGACARCQACPAALGEEAGNASAAEEDGRLAASGEEDGDGNIEVETVDWNEDPDVDPCSECDMCTDSRNPGKVTLQGDALWIERLATPNDLSRYQELSAKEARAMQICREKIALRKLDMKLVTAHFLLGEPKILFFFTADVRVDFRELVRDLVAVFRIRIELRQIGMRDETRMLGGLAICGRDFCCHSVNTDLNSVSIKMAKEQNLSLNSMKISGPCGRLLCCLAYEFDFYVEEKKKYPPEGARVRYGEDLMKISEVNILSKNLTLLGPEGRTVSLPCAAVVWNGEAKRWDIAAEYRPEDEGE